MGAQVHSDIKLLSVIYKFWVYNNNNKFNEISRDNEEKSICKFFVPLPQTQGRDICEIPLVYIND